MLEVILTLLVRNTATINMGFCTLLFITAIIDLIQNKRVRVMQKHKKTHVLHLWKPKNLIKLDLVIKLTIVTKTSRANICYI